tara:strand:+ start:158 stop:757 length:600 start_codon:yes stop_codon:yes gene_type:complete
MLILNLLAKKNTTMKNITFLISVFLITSSSFAQEYSLNTSSSELKWTGTELTTKIHYGSIDFKSGTITLSEGQPVSGKFVVNMTTLKNEDLPEAYRGRLEGHLKSDDFFSVDKFSEAILEINGSNKLSSGSFDVNGNLTIKGITEPINFSMSTSDDHWVANLTFDRSKYNVRFRSGTFFENLGDKLIYDDIVIETKLRF